MLWMVCRNLFFKTRKLTFSTAFLLMTYYQNRIFVYERISIDRKFDDKDNLNHRSVDPWRICREVLTLYQTLQLTRNHIDYCTRSNQSGTIECSICKCFVGLHRLDIFSSGRLPIYRSYQPPNIPHCHLYLDVIQCCGTDQTVYFNTFNRIRLGSGSRCPPREPLHW